MNAPNSHVPDQLQDREEINLAALVSDLARRTGLTIATAECLTNGRVAARLGDSRDAQSWFVGGIIADSLQVKRSLLQVRAAAIVSEQSAREMASAARSMLGADLCIAVTGGAHGVGSDRSPVCFAIADRDGAQAETKQLVGPVSTFATAHALTMLRRRLTAHWQRYRTAS